MSRSRSQSRSPNRYFNSLSSTPCFSESEIRKTSSALWTPQYEVRENCEGLLECFSDTFERRTMREGRPQSTVDDAWLCWRCSLLAESRPCPESSSCWLYTLCSLQWIFNVMWLVSSEKMICELSLRNRGNCKNIPESYVLQYPSLAIGMICDFWQAYNSP